jgi:hypothetical protein
MLPHFKKSFRFLALAACAIPALFVVPVLAADPPYTVSNVHVDASAASTTEAFNAALEQGRPRAWATLYRRLTRQQDWARQPDLDPAALVRISRGYTVANERRSTTRYVADVTYSFNPDAVARLLQGAGIAYTQGAARRILVVPMSPGFQMGPWVQALNAPGLRDSVVPFAVAGDADAASLKDLNFDNGSWNDVAAAAKRVNAGEAALVQSVYANGRLTVNIRRLGPGEVPAKTQIDVPLQQTLGSTYPSAAAAAIGAIEDMWKARAAIDNITGVTVNAMDIGYAEISISYTGSPEQLRDVLGTAGLTLAPVRGQASWTLAMNGGEPQ